MPIIFTKASGGSSAREQFRKDIRGFRDDVSRAVLRAWKCLGAKGEKPTEQFIAKYYLEDVPALQSVDEAKFKQGFPAQVRFIQIPLKTSSSGYLCLALQVLIRMSSQHNVRLVTGHLRTSTRRVPDLQVRYLCLGVRS